MPNRPRDQNPDAALRIAVTGDPGCGKTTLLRRVADELRGKLTVRGLYTEERRRQGARVGFRFVDLETGRRELLAHVDREHGPRVGKYRVCQEGIDDFAVPALEAAAHEADLIVIDEIAPMELTSRLFEETVGRLLEGSVPLLLAIHKRSGHPLLKRIRTDTQSVYEVTPENRDGLVETIARRFISP